VPTDQRTPQQGVFQQPAVSLRSVSRRFGSAWAVNDVSLDIERGTCFGLLGPNGAGKSTTLKMIYGFLRPTSGSIIVGGTDITLDPAGARTAMGIVPQEDLLDPDLDITRNLEFHARYHRIPRALAREKCHALLTVMGLEGYDGRPVSHLSTGLRRRLVLARALLNDPAIIILDEPTRGLDMQSRGRYIEKLQQLKAAGATLILATHDLEKAGALCDRAALMDGGRIRALGSLREVVEAGAGLATASPPVEEAPCPA
jgi:lipooligosaccharide transport system ATP-binding protein